MNDIGLILEDLYLSLSREKKDEALEKYRTLEKKIDELILSECVREEKVDWIDKDLVGLKVGIEEGEWDLAKSKILDIALDILQGVGEEAEIPVRIIE